MFRSYTNEFKYNLRDKVEMSESIDILTSEHFKFLLFFSFCFRDKYSFNKLVYLVNYKHRPLALRGHVTNASFKQ